MAAELNCEEIYLADLIQEANLALLAALKETEPQQKNDAWMRGRIRSGNPPCHRGTDPAEIP